MRNGRRAGFTALELFTALSIIAIASLGVFAMGHGAISSARTGSCISNVRQIATACLVYAQDSDGHLPTPAFACPLMEYVKNNQVFVCPEAHRVRQQIANRTGETVPYPANGTDYVLNWRLKFDDFPQNILLADNTPRRHQGKYWNGARLDGAGITWPAEAWNDKMKWVTDHAPTR